MPSYYTIEEFSERRKLRDKLLNAIDTKAPRIRGLVKAMEDLNKKMNAYSALDRWGVAKQIDEAGKQELIKEIKTTALAGEKFLENVKDSKDKKVQELADTVRKLQGLMSHDMNLLQQYDPNGPEKKSLPELQEMSGFQSERIPMTLQDAKGKKISGFFTKASKFTILPAFNGLLEWMNNLADDKEFFKDFLNKYRPALAKGNPKAKDYSDEYLIGTLLKNSSGGQPNFLKTHLAKVFDKSVYDINNAFGSRGLTVFTEGLQNIAKTPAFERPLFPQLLNAPTGLFPVSRPRAVSDIIIV